MRQMHGLRALFFCLQHPLKTLQKSPYCEGGYPSDRRKIMQVTKVTAGFQNQTAERKTFTDEELQREFDYYMAQKLLKKLREADLISEDELDKITAKNRQSFSPYLARIMP